MNKLSLIIQGNFISKYIILKLGLDDQVKYRLELYLALKVPMVEISKESDKVRGRDKRPCLIKRRLNNAVNNNKKLHLEK